MDSNVTALATRQDASVQAFEPDSITSAMDLSRMLVKSSLMPKHLRAPEDCLLVIMTGREMGLTVMQSIRGMHVIEGKVSLSADLIVALVKRHADCEYFRLVQSTDEIASYETLRKGDPEPTRLSYTIKQASAAGLVSKDNWKKHPAAMLRARCSAAIARAVYPDGALGLYDTDEGEEIAERRPPVAKIRSVVQEETGNDMTGVLNASVDKLQLDHCVALELKLRDAQSEQELLRVSKDIVGAHEAGHITDAHRSQLRSIYTQRHKDVKSTVVA